MAVIDNVDKFILGDSWLGDLGFISPIKVVKDPGSSYFLHSNSKVLKDTISFEGPLIFSRILSSVKPGVSLYFLDRTNDSGALRAVDSLYRGLL